MKRSRLALALALTMLLCACPSIDTIPPDPTIRQLGVVSISASYNDAGTYEIYGAGGLFLPVERSLTSLETFEDRCFVNDAPNLFPEETFATLLDAGEVITIRDNGEPFTALTRITFMGGGYGYTAGEFGTFPRVPQQGLVAEVPGAAFPAMSGEFPAPPPPVELAGETVTLTVDGSFTWEPYTVDGVVSLIGFQVSSDLENPNEPYVLANCVALDDGEFSFPSAVSERILELSPAFEGSVLPLRRSVYRLEVDGDAALVVGVGDSTQEVLRTP